MDALLQSAMMQDFGLPLGASLATGVLVGLERELRAKDAGLRTHTLVCFASTLLMLMAVHQNAWIVDFMPAGEIVSDPTRVAHGVLTGIGFLCAGVIFREGPTVHGLTTAASLWITAALGLLYGAGLFELAAAGTAATLAVLVLFRLLGWLLPHRIETSVRVRAAPDSGFDAAALRKLLASLGLRSSPIATRLAGGGEEVEVAAVAWLGEPSQGDALAARLRSAGVSGFEIVPVESRICATR